MIDTVHFSIQMTVMMIEVRLLSNAMQKVAHLIV